MLVFLVAGIPKIYVNEVMTNPTVVGNDWIELFNK